MFVLFLHLGSNRLLYLLYLLVTQNNIDKMKALLKGEGKGKPQDSIESGLVPVGLLV